MPNVSKTRRIGLLVLLASLFLSACSGLAGEVEIVATAPPAVPVQAEIPLPPAPPNLANGAAIYAQNCTDCHGETGVGDGELVENGSVPRMPSFLENRHVRTQTPAFYYDIIANGNLVNLMPPWSESLSVQERWDVAMYIYTLHYTDEQVTQGAQLVSDAAPQFSIVSDAEIATGYQSADLTEDDTFAAAAFERLSTLDTEPPAEPVENTTFMGTAINGTEGSSVPDDLIVTLRYGNLDDGFETLETRLDENQQYRFEDVPVTPTYNYVVIAIYNNLGFPSDIIGTPDITTNETTLNVTIYERTEEQAAITLVDVIQVVEPLSIEEMGNGLIISQVNTYQNTSDRVFHLQPDIGDESGNLPAISLLVQIPPGAVFLPGINDTQRYILAQDQYALIDTAPIFPGEHEVRMGYFVPYENSAVVDLALNYNFSGTATVQLASSILELIGEPFEYVGEANLGTTAEPFLVQDYAGDFDLTAGESLRFELSGSIFGSNTSLDGGIITGDTLLPVLLIVGLLLIVGIVGLFWLQGRNPENAQVNALIRQLAQLDAQHESGQLDDTTYQTQRQALKDQLSNLMANTKDEPS